MTLRTSIAGFALVAVLVAGIALQRQSLMQARAENRNLQARMAVRSGDSLSPDPSRGQAVPAPHEEALRELPRLRNEIRQLRAQKQELAKLQAENESLSNRLNERKAVREVSEPIEAAGFVMNNAWTYAGFGSPEAAVQSFFSALRDNSIANLVSCITPQAARNMGLIDEDTGKLYEDAADQVHFWSMGKIKGYRIAEIQPRADDRVKVKLQAAVNGESVEFSVRRIGQEWKLELDR